MFGMLKSEPHKQPAAGCYSNDVHHQSTRQTLSNVQTIPEDDKTKTLLKQFWLYSCEIAREQPSEAPVTVKEQADKLLALTKTRALSRIEAHKTTAAA